MARVFRPSRREKEAKTGQSIAETRQKTVRFFRELERNGILHSKLEIKIAKFLEKIEKIF